MSLPFAISEEAARYLCERFKHARAGMVPSLHGASWLEVRDKHGRLVERCDRKHYFVGSGMPTDYQEHLRLDLFGHSVAIHPKTLAGLAGRRLIVGRSDPIEGIDYTKEILFAIPVDEPTPQT